MVLVFCSSAWALNYTDHINTAPNNKGDMLIFPWFLALDGGWQTKLTVINTDEVNSVVAKVVFRSFKNSEELLDFLIYLTPADVWTGKVYYDGISKTIKVFSDDDSILTSTAPTFATPAAPVNQPFFPVTCDDDGDFLGYIEVIEAGWAPITNPAGAAAPGVLKSKLYAAYPTLMTTTNTINVLAGYMEFGNPVLGMTAGYRATNFRDYDNQLPLDTGNETKIGVGCNNSMAEIEASFTKDDIALPYVNANDVALHFFTFPTKLTNFATCTAVTTGSPYFNDNADSKTCILYSIKTYDLKENSPQTGSPFSGGTSIPSKFCDEVNFVSASDFPYAEGWAHYNFSDVTFDATKSLAPLQYWGAPVIPTYLYIGEGGLSSEYGAWTDSYVFNTWTAPVFPAGPEPRVLGPALLAQILTDYQYTDMAVEHTWEATKR